MNVHELLAAAVLGVVEGVTEFLPVSSTGHMIVVGAWLDFTGERAKTFEISIQLGAILAVVLLYRERFLSVARDMWHVPASRRFVTNLAVGFLPAAIVGLLAHHWIKARLFTPLVVGLGFIGGGLVMLAIERWRPKQEVAEAIDIPTRTALGIGLVQVLALVPGVSRSGATIIGGYALGLSRTAATEFSFFLAVPVIAAAAGLDVVRSLDTLSLSDAPVFAVGFLVAFLSALIVVKLFLRYVVNHTFSVFAWYRIGFGILLVWLYARTGFPAS